MSREARTFAPGRVEILGNYTDLVGGAVLAASLRQGVTVVAREGAEAGVLRCRSSRMREEIVIDLARAPGESEPLWSRYVVGVAAEMGVQQGVELEIASDLPSGSGLASSAALTAAVALSLGELFGNLPGTVELARLCQRVEHRHVGVQCGLLDPLCALAGVPGGALHVDAATMQVTPVELPADAALVLIRSRVGRELAGGAYNERCGELEQARRLLGDRSILQVEDADLEALPDPLASRARHVRGEHRRVALAVPALAVGDLEAVGGLMLESHASSQENFANSCVELDCLVELARLAPGCHGARLTGAGFGGATVSLVDRRKLDTFRASMTREVMRHFGFPPDLLEVGLVGSSTKGG